MKSRLLILALSCLLGLGTGAFAQAPKTGKGKDDKKASAPKTPADLAYDAFTKVRTEKSAFDQARFQRVIKAGLDYLLEYPTHARVNDAIRDLAFFGSNFGKQPALRTAYSSLLKLDVTNLRYKEGLSDQAKLVLAALDATIADNDVREAFNTDNLATLREKIDTLAGMPGGARYLVERERSYSHVLLIGANAARAEAHLKKLLEHKEKPVVAMAREELNIVEAMKEPATFKFSTLDGKEVDLAQMRGKVVAMYFWSSANKSSTDRLDALKQLHSTYRKRNFEVVTVAYDKEEDRPKLEKFIKDKRIAWPVYYDGKGAKNEFASKLNATAVPRLYLFDQKGVLQTTLTGSPVLRVTADFPQNQLEGKVKQLLGLGEKGKK